MRRLAVALCALLLSMTVALGLPERLDAAAPPPPCPNGDTFIFCLSTCPLGDLEQACLSLAGRPPNCRVEQPFCFTISYPYNCGPEGSAQLWCPYQSTY